MLILIPAAGLVCLALASDTSWFFAVVFAALAIHLLAPYSLKRRFARFVADHDYLVCLECGYALHGLPEPICPECGTPFDEAEVKAKWRTWIATKGVELELETQGDESQ